MFGRMNIQKAKRFYESSYPFTNFKERVESGQYEISLGYWDNFDRNIHNLFRRQYKITLSVEQRWHIFLELLVPFQFDADEALAEFAKGGMRQIGIWSATAGSDVLFDKMKFADFNKFSDFPSNELFNYSINNYQIVYPNNKEVAELIELLDEYISAPNEAKTMLTLKKFRRYITL